MARLQVERLCVHADAFRLRGVTLSVEAERTLVVLGPSGAGKTVLLDALAGFRAAASGRILLGDRDITALSPEARRIGLVFQDYALFPHLSVLENVRFGLRARGDRDPGRARAMLDRLGIGHLAGRRPASLSGGERQRVALARALVVEPDLLLLDEPLSALDAPTRDDVREDLRRLLAGFRIATVFVTHDQSEALALADDLAIVIDGCLRQIGAAQEVFDAPADLEIARFLAMESLGEGQAGPAGTVMVAGRPLCVGPQAPPPGRFAVCYRAEDVRLVAADDPSDPNRFALRVAALTPLGPLMRVRLEGGSPLTALAFRRAVAELGLREGMRVYAALPPAALRLVPLSSAEYGISRRSSGGRRITLCDGPLSTRRAGRVDERVQLPAGDLQDRVDVRGAAGPRRGTIHAVDYHAEQGIAAAHVDPLRESSIADRVVESDRRVACAVLTFLIAQRRLIASLLDPGIRLLRRAKDDHFLPGERPIDWRPGDNDPRGTHTILPDDAVVGPRAENPPASGQIGGRERPGREVGCGGEVVGGNVGPLVAPDMDE